MACPQGKRSPCRRSGQGAVGRPEWEGLRGLRVPDTLWRAAAGGPGHATGQAWSSTRFGRHRPLKTTASQRLPARSGAEAPGGGPGHQGRGECPRRAGSDPSRSTPRRPRRRERNRPGPGRCGRCPVRTDRGLGSGRQRTGWAGMGRLCVCRRLCRGLGKDRFPGPGRRPGSKAKEVRSRRAGRQVGLGLAEEAAAGAGRVSSPVGEGGVPRGLAVAAT